MSEHRERRPDGRPLLATGLRDAARPAVRLLRRVAHRLLHPWRRRRALARLRALRPIRSVTFICLGNICRSPYAEAVLASLAAENGLNVRSAGLLRGGRPSPPEAVRAAGPYGEAMTRHVSRRVDVELVTRADLVVVMDPRQMRPLLDQRLTGPASLLVLGDLDPEPGESRTITDPFGRELGVFEDVYRRIDRCVAVLYRELRAGG